MIFKDRKEAGQRLAGALKDLKGKNVLILAIPRGGVPVAKEVASELNAELDVIITRKVGAPNNPEYAIGSVTQKGFLLTDKEFAKSLGISEKYLLEESKRQAEMIRDRLKRFRGDRPYPSMQNRIVVIVDDGIATGYTVRAAARFVKMKKPSELILAVPVAPADTIEELRKEVDRVVCLSTPEPFYAIGEFYADFDQVEDEEVKEILESASTSSARRKGT
jgi:putative phosphoribosyl transferase